MFELTEEDFQNPFEYAHYDKIKPCQTCGCPKENVIVSFKYEENSFLFTVICVKCKTTASSITNWDSGKYDFVGRKKKKNNKRKR